MSFDLKRLTGSPDFKESPLKALAKRVVWHSRWAIRTDPWKLELNDGSRILTHKGGTGAVIFFQKTAEPETAAFLEAFLRPGMVMVDGGANIGEYTLRAARLVGASGEVHAFEPSPETFSLLQQSIQENGFTNVYATCGALGESDGKFPFRIESDPALNRLQPDADPETYAQGIILVGAFRIDSYWSSRSRPIDLIKLDVEGAELFVLKGSEHLAQHPVWYFEACFDNYSFFGYRTSDILAAFHDRGYAIWSWDGYNCSPVKDLSNEGKVNLIAAPRGRHPLKNA